MPPSARLALVDGNKTKTRTTIRLQERFLHINRTNMPHKTPKNEPDLGSMSAKLQRAPRATRTNRRHKSHASPSDKAQGMANAEWDRGIGYMVYGIYGHKPQNLISVMLYSSGDKRKSAQLTAGRQCRTLMTANIICASGSRKKDPGLQTVFNENMHHF